eukprot:TRINITY_DN1231_c0_g1_i1.p1 TRINITY_DN1231_c0_g1~~TRINITY_DN1231_c0_g1_i1.p1  ORF type:complete len:110 (+),score=23.60 TRINITY_DN1231_c0_g1_i1:141-470(+)
MEEEKKIFPNLGHLAANSKISGKNTNKTKKHKKTLCYGSVCSSFLSWVPVFAKEFFKKSSALSFPSPVPERSDKFVRENSHPHSFLPFQKLQRVRQRKLSPFNSLALQV